MDSRESGLVMHCGPPTAARALGIVLLTLAPLADLRVPSVIAQTPPASSCSEPIPDLYDRVSSTVVYIAATSINPYQVSDRVTRVVGSGFIVESGGLIVTNSHVAFGRQSIRVTLDSGASLSAELVGADPIFDLAVLRIVPPADTTLSTAALGDSDRVRVGDEVLAIGNPLGLDQTLTRGIVSATNRVLPETPASLQEPLIQTDAAINPGSSGGPLLNRCGEVIGINTAIVQSAQGIGFAVPINLLKTALPSLVAKGRVVRPWIGFHGQLVGDTLRDLVRVPLVEGLLVEVVEPGSPAEQAGIRGGQLDLVIAGRDFLVGGDIITRVNDTRLSSPERLMEAIRVLEVGSTLHLTVFRSGSYQEVEYVLPERPLLPGDIPGKPSLQPSAREGARRPGASR